MTAVTWHDLKKGDSVRVTTKYPDGTRIAVEGKVTKNDGKYLYIGDEHTLHRDYKTTIGRFVEYELLDRPFKFHPGQKVLVEATISHCYLGEEGVAIYSTQPDGGWPNIPENLIRSAE